MSSSRTVTIELPGHIVARINIHNLEKTISNSNWANINGNKESMDTDTNAINEDIVGGTNDLDTIETQSETKLVILENWRKLKARKGKGTRKEIETATKSADDTLLIQIDSSAERERLVRRTW